MAPSHSRQLLVWTLPTIAVLLSYLWYKRKRIGARSDPGDTKLNIRTEEAPTQVQSNNKSLQEELNEASSDQSSSTQSSPNKSFSRSLSGVDSAPIDIVIPPELRSTKSNPVIISDEDLDFEIEKIKSMKNGIGSKSKPNDSILSKSKTPSPKKENFISNPTKNNSTAHKQKKNTAKNNKDNRKKQPQQKETNMAQKDIAVVEEKLTTLNLSNCKESPKKRSEEKNMNENNNHREEFHRQSSERDSANHSPADVMLASPSLSSISDNHSEGSSDSGKGGSDVATPPPSRTPGAEGSVSGDVNLPALYEFIIPQTQVGKLIGRNGSFVTQIKDKTNAHIIVKKHPTNSKLKVCAIEGVQSEIDKALKMIRDKFPLKRYPDLTLEQVSFVPLIPTIPLIPDHLYLKLVEGVNNDSILSCMVAPNHLFLQQPTHPSYPSLNLLSNYMNICYNEAESPLLPNPIPENTVCAAYSVDAWYRAMILSTDTETDTSYVKFLDYGGFAYVENSKLRQIRGDFMLLPFQAAECFLANIKPVGDSEMWADEAYNLVADLTKGAIIYTQVADYTEDGIPLVLCYVVLSPQQVVFLNQELVNSGFAEWTICDEEQEVAPLEPAETTEGAVGGVVA